jgi:hypothetical protein
MSRKVRRRKSASWLDSFVDLLRKVFNGEDLPGEEAKPSRGKKKRRRLRKRKPSTMSGPNRTRAGMAGTADGGGDGSETEEP